MEEHVALDSKKQKKFVKSLKGIKKLMKETGALPEKPQKQKKHEETGKIKKKRRPRRGLVYLSHIPHGFYEHQMTDYFKQFGVVTNARVIRSKRTGRSKGHAFVEFRDMTVAQVVAETMNNYLMGKRLIKAVYIPPKDQRVNARRKNWNLQNNPGRKMKLKMKKAYNSKKSENEDMKIARKLFTNLTNTKNKLKDLGIDYDFFTPVDVPEGLMEQLEVKKEHEDKKGIVDEKPNKKKEKKNKGLINETDDKNKITDIVHTKQEKPTTKEKKQKKGNKDLESNEKNAIVAVNNKNNKQVNGTEKIKESAKDKKNKKDNKETTVLETNKKEKLKEAGVKPLEDYISIVDEEDDDSDSSYQFDSDEYDNELNADDSDTDASSEDDEDNNDNDESNEDDDNEESDEDIDDSDSKEIPLQRINKKAKKIKVPTEASKPKVKQVPFMQQMKRKVAEKTAVPSKKPKFEKQNNKKLPSKQLKKKK